MTVNERVVEDESRLDQKLINLHIKRVVGLLR